MRPSEGSVKLKLNEWMYVICISYTYHSQQSLACSTQNMQAKSFAFGQLLEKGNYLVGSSSGAIYGKENTGIVLLTHFRNFIYCTIYIALAILESAHDKAFVVAMCMDKDAGLEKNLEESDMVLQPSPTMRTMAQCSVTRRPTRLCSLR